MLVSRASKPSTVRWELLLLLAVASMLCMTYLGLHDGLSADDAALQALAAEEKHYMMTPETPKEPVTESIIDDVSPPDIQPITTTPSPTPTPTPTPSETPKLLTAVLIETSLSPQLVPILMHFSAVLGPHWNLTLYTSAESWTEHPKSAPFLRLLASGQLSVRYLPDDVHFTNSASVSKFLAEPWLWEDLADSHRILMFQLDSIICANSDFSVDDFLKWDFIGAPIASRYGQGYNGGLSLRNPRLFLEIIKETGGMQGKVEFEDQWFFKQAKKLDAERGVMLPNADEAKKFSVETIYYERPFGYHQPMRWQKDNMTDIESWCPEVRMLIGRRAT
ncbi:hypothetical protein QBC38DRAFT_467170 [Podospora fimiseda]|uniref:DUF5672 domain-containing protein n=1 Tax=Podospora fimiseda TaxID=252190 RepID=A0AAN7H7S7_9PEZI|nr:hypothetical protein QBC38DRAFT_467170 [Podospora fimiseda]